MNPIPEPLLKTVKSQLTGYLRDGTPIDNRIVICGGSRIELVWKKHS